MKKFFSLVITLLILTSTCYASSTTVVERDKYGRKVATYKTNSNGTTTSYDRYGRKTGSYKTNSNGTITQHDKYGRKVKSYR
ncbi:MAG: hypothetical protein NC390_00470 [Fusobacterium sp.]|nr:hypothetical protein [Fusobacterium sp.]